MNEVYLNDVFSQLWKDADPIAEADKLDGEVFRKVKSRRTFRFELNGRGYFAKIHKGAGWREIFKNLFQFKKPVLGAGNEYHAIRLLEKLGVPTMTPAAYASRGLNPASVESFLITEEITGAVSLEDYCRDWERIPPPSREKKRLVRRLARTAAAMHDHGLNHRDCYICHFLLKKSTGELHVIDLHRAQIRRRIPYRYRVKDVAGLYFSAMDCGLARRDLLRFVAVYGRRTPDFWRRVRTAAEKLYRKIHGRPSRYADSFPC